MRPAVSVIIPAYNAEQYVERCLNSVLDQSLADLEVIVVDDGSNDSTLEILETIAGKDSRLTVLHQENRYAGEARNTGLSHASGKYLYFLDADDFIEPNALSELTSAAESYDADIVVCKSDYFDNVSEQKTPIAFALRDVPFNTPISQQEMSRVLFRSFVGWPWDKLFRKSFIDKNELTFQSLRTSNDARFVFCALACAETTVCLDQTLVNHRTNNNSSLEHTREKSWDNALFAIKGIRETLDLLNRFHECSQSFNNWMVNFIRWNIATLDADSASALFNQARPLIDELPTSEDYYFYKEDYYFIHFMNQSFAHLLAISADSSSLSDHLSNDVSQLKERINRLEQENARLSNLESERNKNLIAELQEVRNSKSFKIGYALLHPFGVHRKL